MQTKAHRRKGTATPFILAIDDDPGRYEYLRRLVEPKGIEVVCVCCESCTLGHLRSGLVFAVLLDYDLDSGEDCGCGMPPERSKGADYLAEIARTRLPVIVSSCSAYENRRSMTCALQFADTKVTEIAANVQQPELRWIGWLWAVGAIR